jgi:hypothetical protein
MALSIGIDCSITQWRICLREHGKILHLRSFEDVSLAISYLERICALYPEPTIVLPAGNSDSLARLSIITDQQCADLMETFKVIQALSLDSYCLPAIKHLASVAMHRKIKSMNMGKSDSLCTIATLIYRLSERQTAWSEMNFLYVEVGNNSMRIVVVEDGRIVDGISQDQVTEIAGTEDSMESNVNGSETRLAPEEAFWEELARALGGLMAIHHLEDIIVIGPKKNAFVNRFAETYQVYYFPDDEAGNEGYEVAIGAAIIAEGLRHSGLAGEVVKRLQIL